MPRPAPAPIRPVMARPAPMYLAAVTSMSRRSPWLGWSSVSVVEIDHLVEVDAGQRREHERLQKGDHQFQQHQSDDHAERHHGCGEAEAGEPALQPEDA